MGGVVVVGRCELPKIRAEGTRLNQRRHGINWFRLGVICSATINKSVLLKMLFSVVEGNELFNVEFVVIRLSCNYLLITNLVICKPN